VDASELEDRFLGPVDVLLLEFFGKSHTINIAKKTPKSASFLSKLTVETSDNDDITDHRGHLLCNIVNSVADVKCIRAP
jgi:hypothetical protein